MIVAAPPGTSVRYVMDEGYTLTDHYLATLSEQQAGLITLQSRHRRPGVAVEVEATRRTNRDVFAGISAFEAYRAKKMKATHG